MKSESDPITDEEWLLRRVRREQFRTEKHPLISPNAFEPRIKGRDPDTDGISLYRQACLAEVSLILVTLAPERHSEYGIVRVPVTLLRTLNLTVTSIPDERIPGHVVIPELNASDYAADKSAFLSIKETLATVASEDANILRWPQARDS
jgi:hypothetical protein